MYPLAALLLDVTGLALTLIALALLAAGGYLAALRLLGEEARRDLLALAIATLLAATAEALAIGLALGALGLLRFELALGAQALLVALLARAARRGPAAAGTGDEARRLAGRVWQRLREYPALSLIAIHAAGSEALRGLLRPPLSYDSLMYHLLLTATWLQERNLEPFNGNYPVSDYGYVPANGSIWFWWWMAPSHSELYVNLGALPHWVLLGLAVGGIARQLGARRHWPLASYLVALLPIVVRFVATQYVDIFLAATLLAGCFFVMRWLDRAHPADAFLAGAGCGLACGAKILGVPYAAAMAMAAILLVPSSKRAREVFGEPAERRAPPSGGRPAGLVGWRARLPQVALAVLVAAALGGFFYLRNMALGVGPLAMVCEGWEPTASTESAAPITSPGIAPSPSPRNAAQSILPALPRPQSLLDLWSTVGRRQLLDAFLGVTSPASLELGMGPAVFLLLLGFLALPFGVAAEQRRAALLAASQIAFELLFWVAVPYAANLAVFANVRYLIPAAGLAAAGAIAIAERRGMSDLWLRGLAIATSCQALMQLHTEMPRGVRVTIAVIDLGVVVFAMSCGLRRLVRRRAPAFAAAALVLALLGAPVLARFRTADRARALASEWTGHQTPAKVLAGAWGWLDAHGGDATVAFISSPGSFFVYPAMGLHLERRTRYFNVNAANYGLAGQYPHCNPRVDPDPSAWLDHLAAGNPRWLLISRYPGFDWPVEREWAQANPARFEPRFADDANQIYEYHPLPLIPRR
jgi:hypothetical protein